MAEHDDSKQQVRDFMRARSKAAGDQFETFYRSRNLDMDDSRWTAAQRAEYKKESDALTAEWDARQQQLLATLRTDYPDGEWTRD